MTDQYSQSNELRFGSQDMVFHWNTDSDAANIPDVSPSGDAALSTDVQDRPLAADGTAGVARDGRDHRAHFDAHYASSGARWEDYEPAYRYGWESRARYGNRNWDEVEPELGRNWNEYNRGAARQTWDEAKLATKDAWHRVEDRLPGDADRDGR